MDGIYTSLGVQEWLSGSKKIVREWTTMLFDTASTGEYIGFQEDAQGATIPANGTALSLTFQEAETTLKTKGQFAEKNFVATHLAIEILLQVPTSTTAGNDTNPLVADVIEFNERTFFEMFFDSGDTAHDRGRVYDFPAGRGFTSNGTTATSADTGSSKLLCNGIPSQDGIVTMKTPYRCTSDTRPRCVLSVLSRGAIGVSVDMAIRPNVIGYK